MREYLIIFLMAAVALATACRKEVAPSASEQNTNQVGTDVSTPPQAGNTSESEPRTTSQPGSFKPKNGYVPDEETAIAIAVAIWIPIYGRAEIEGEKPYRATLQNGVWDVRGTLPEGYVGGTAVAEIAQDDGRVLRVIHESFMSSDA